MSSGVQAETRLTMCSSCGEDALNGVRCRLGVLVKNPVGLMIFEHLNETNMDNTVQIKSAFLFF